jgi:hypothetical protein
LALGKNVGSYQKNNKAKRAWGTTQVVEYPCLASVRLGVQTPVPQKKKKKKNGHHTFPGSALGGEQPKFKFGKLQFFFTFFLLNL